MRILVTGGSGAIGRRAVPALMDAGHRTIAPRRDELDLFDPLAVNEVVYGVDAVVHLATRIPPLDSIADPAVWEDNDRLRAEATRVLVDAAIAASAELFIFPSVTFVYPAGVPADESTPIGRVPFFLGSALEAEEQVGRFASSGGRGVVLRLGLLDGPGTANDEPIDDLGASIHVDDAALAIVVALHAPSGTYNICRDSQLVSNAAFKAVTTWRPKR